MTEIRVGDCLAVLPTMAADSIDAIVTDPPYGLEFMGKEWDHGVPGAHFWQEALRVAKPGAYLVAFGGTRTHHRLMVAIEDAGWEIRDTLMWLYGSGFPKSKNVALSIDKGEGLSNRGHRIATASRHHPDGTLEPNGEQLPPYEARTDAARQWAGWGTALKPAWEPIILARKPLVGTVAQNVQTHGVGGLNIDGCRIAGAVPTTTRGNSFGRMNDDGWQESQTSFAPSVSGRWPANLLLDEDSAMVLDAQTGDTPSGGALDTAGITAPNLTYGARPKQLTKTFARDSGGPSRFFYCAKASKRDRGEGNTHPTVKPTDLMRWLVTLVTPPGGTVLDPFMGSGSTGKACAAEGMPFIGIELSPAYATMAATRMGVEPPAPVEETPAAPDAFTGTIHEPEPETSATDALAWLEAFGAN